MANIVSSRPLVLVAGGTGGHIFPALSVARFLKAEGHCIYLITDQRGQKYVPSDLFEKVEILSVHALQGTILRKAWGLFRYLQGVLSMLWWTARVRPKVVWGFGGYLTLAPLLAARILGISTGLHQADRLCGKANRLLARFAKVVCTSFPDALGFPPQVPLTLTGLPVRAEIESVQKSPYPVRRVMAPFHLLVLGGSQGAKFWSSLLPQALQLLTPEKQALFHIVQQCRPESLEIAKTAYQATNVCVKLVPFIADMHNALVQAHLVLARAGTSTIAELSLVGRPALLVPYPFAAEDHQTINAQYLTGKDAGWMQHEKNFTVEQLADFLEHVLDQPQILEKVAKNVSTIAVPGATQHVARIIESFVI